MINTRVTRSCTATAAGMSLAFALAGMVTAGEPAVSVETLVKQGDPIPGHGEVGSTPADVNVNNDGFWLATLSTANPTGRVILTSDGVHAADGDILDGNIPISSLANVHKGLNNNGHIIYRPTFGDGLNSGVVWNGDPVIMHNQVSTAPEFTPGTPYIGFFRAKINDNNRALLMATVNDPGLDGTVHRALVWLERDVAAGTVTESVLAKKFDHLPGQPDGVLVNDFGTNSERWAINNNDDAIYAVSFTGGDSATNAAIYINDTVVAQKGDFGAFKDVSYNVGTSSTTRVDIKDNGDYIMLMPLAGGPTATNQALLRNNMFDDGPDEVIIRKGDPVPGVDGAVIASFGTGAQPFITNAGDVVWYASWSGQSGTERGLFVNDELLVHTGVTTTSDGDVITNIAGTTNSSNGLGDGFQVSDNGRYIVARAVLNASTSERAVVMIDRGDIEPKCIAEDINCDSVVDVSDLLLLLAAWGDCDDCGDCPADINQSCNVDVSDLLQLLAAWGCLNLHCSAHEPAPPGSGFFQARNGG